MTQLKQPFIEAAKFRQVESGGDKKSEVYQKSVIVNLPQPIKSKNVSESLAEKAGISSKTMQDALTVDAKGTEEHIEETTWYNPIAGAIKTL